MAATVAAAPVATAPAAVVLPAGNNACAGLAWSGAMGVERPQATIEMVASTRAVRTSLGMVASNREIVVDCGRHDSNGALKRQISMRSVIRKATGDTRSGAAI